MRYQLNYMFWASLIAFAIMAAVLIVIIIFSTTANFDGAQQIIIDAGIVDFNFDTEIITTYNIVGFLALMLFIIGISGTREDLRFSLQHGIGRKSTYFATLFTSLIIGAVYALIGELLNLAFVQWASFPISGTHINNAGFIGGWLLQTLTLFLAWQFGALISLIYYRLNKTAQIVFSVAVIALLVFGLPRFVSNFVGFALTGYYMVNFVTGFIEFFTNPLNITLITLIAGALCAIGNFLLIRRAPIKE